jgi:hypothetical protein
VTTFLTQIQGSGTGQYFADQNNQPYLVRWDTVWALITNAGNSGGATTYQTDMDNYCSIRSSLGFNGFLSTPTGTTQSGGPSNNGHTWDGVAPFSSPGVLNNTFWTRVDYLLNSAQSNGMTVVLNVAFTYAFAPGCPLDASVWTNTQYQNYGTALGGRYKNQANLVWEFGDDYDEYSVDYDTQFNAILTGIRGAGDTHLISIENINECTSRYAQDGSEGFDWGIASAQFDWCYSYNTAYNAVEDAYTEAAAHSVPSICVCKMDGWYDNEWFGNTPTESVELYGRKWAWWSLSSGSRGTMYGNGDLYPWPTGVIASGLAGSSPGSQYMQPAALDSIWNTFASFPGWHRP